MNIFSIYQDDADSIWYEALRMLRDQEKIQTGRDQSTHELLLTTMYLENPRNRFVLSRNIDLAFAFVEVFWHLSGRNDLEFLNSWNKRMKTFSDDGQTLHGAYGYRLRGKGKYDIDQLEAAYIALRLNSDTRQVGLQIWDALDDMPDTSGKPVSKDIPCNLDARMLVRDGKLYWHQHQRSQDLIWGFPYDIIHWTMIMEIFAGWLGVNVGLYKLSSDSLHIYERHWKLLEATTKSTENGLNIVDLRLPYEESLRVIDECTDFIEDLGVMPSVKEIYDLLNDVNDRLPESYADILHVIAAERLYRLDKSECTTVIYNCHNQLYRYVWINYYQERQIQKMIGGKA